MMRWIVLALALCGNFKGKDAPQEVDFIEINKMHMSETTSYRQVIFWVWHPEFGKHHASTWIIIERDEHEPVYRNGRWHAVYRGYDGKLRRAISKTLRETETDYDPENHDKRYLPEEMRIKLKGMVPPPLRRVGPVNEGVHDVPSEG